MKKITFLFIVIPILCFCQVQIGNDINGTNITDRFGISVSISSDGNIVAIGSDFSDENGFNSGSVKVFTNINSNWEQLGNTISGEAEFDSSGIVTTLSSDGTTVAISAFGNDGNGDRAGHVRIFKFQNNSWIQFGSDIDGENELDFFGRSTSLSSNGSIIAISSSDNDTNGENTGHVKIYNYQANNWIQLGNTLHGNVNFERFGISASLSGNGTILAVGSAGNSGKTSIYQFQGNDWIQLGNDINSEALNDQSGQCISLSSDGHIIAIGAPLNDANGNASGHVRVFEYLNNEWQQLGYDIDGEVSNDYSGWSLSLSSDGSTVAIGAHLNDGSEPDAGHVRVYKLENNSWTQVGIDIDGEASEDNFGSSVSLSGDGTTLAVGALNNDANGTDSGHVRIFDLTDALSIDEFQNSTFQLYPNPTKTQFTIQLDPTSILEKVTIYNTLGQLVLISKELIVNTSKLASGTYLVEVLTNKGKGTKKLIIE